MTKLTLPIELGKQYVRRDGKVVTASQAQLQLVPAQVCVAAPGEDATAQRHVIATTGRVYALRGSESPYDLVADYIEQPKGHPHAENMAEYAKDAATNIQPWTLWEFKACSNVLWRPCIAHPKWDSQCEYRRKPPPPKFVERYSAVCLMPAGSVYVAEGRINKQSATVNVPTHIKCIAVIMTLVDTETQQVICTEVQQP